MMKIETVDREAVTADSRLLGWAGRQTLSWDPMAFNREQRATARIRVKSLLPSQGSPYNGGPS